MSEEKRYEPGRAGWVIRWAVEVPQTGRTAVSYWYGPDHGWGQTWGGLDYSVAVFPTRKAAEVAWRSVYHGRPRPGRGPIRVADAEAETAMRREAARVRGEAGAVDWFTVLGALVVVVGFVVACLTVGQF